MPSTKSSKKLKPSSFQFDAIGTAWNIDIYDDITEERQTNILSAIKKRIGVFDKNYSRFRTDSPVTLMSKKAGIYKLPADAKPMLELYRQLYELTDGAVTPMIGNVLSDAGYDAEYSLKSRTLHAPPDWDSVMSYGYESITLQQPVLLDFGAVGKGYLVDIIGNVLKKYKIKSFCVDAGGDLLCHRPDGQLEIGLEHPADPTLAIGIAHIGNKALCGSAGNRRKWGKYHHIINPHTLESPTHIAAVWVVAETAMLADGLTTALFFVEPKALHKQYNFEYAIVSSDYSLMRSADFPAEFFT